MLNIIIIADIIFIVFVVTIVIIVVEIIMVLVVIPAIAYMTGWHRMSCLGQDQRGRRRRSSG